jgi:hypothetical protein
MLPRRSLLVRIRRTAVVSFRNSLLSRPAGRRLCPGSFLARPEFASVEGAAPFQVPPSALAVFQKWPRKSELGSSFPPPAALRGCKDVSLSSRFSWLRPSLGHSPSLIGNSSVTSLYLFRLRRPGIRCQRYFVSGGLLRARTLNQIGEPSNPNAARIWFSRKRSNEKCSFTSRSVNSTNVGGATAACVM